MKSFPSRWKTVPVPGVGYEDWLESLRLPGAEAAL